MMTLPLALNTTGPAVPTMSSREIAELVESRHDSVKRTVERLAEKAVIGLPPTVEYLDNLGRRASEYRIGKRDSYVVVAQLSPEFTARLVDRWQELEDGARPIVPTNFAAALRLAADQAEQLAVMAPKAAALDQIADTTGSFALSDAGKMLGLRPRDIFPLLAERGWIYRSGKVGSWHGYADKIEAGLLVHKVRTSASVARAFDQVRITTRGLARVAVDLKVKVQLDLLGPANDEVG